MSRRTKKTSDFKEKNPFVDELSRLDARNNLTDEERALFGEKMPTERKGKKGGRTPSIKPETMHKYFKDKLKTTEIMQKTGLTRVTICYHRRNFLKKEV